MDEHAPRVTFVDHRKVAEKRPAEHSQTFLISNRKMRPCELTGHRVIQVDYVDLGGVKRKLAAAMGTRYARIAYTRQAKIRPKS